ncbi:MAG: hypothetical protein ACOYM3_17550 [Terrimicrobiaceae bacterium]
MNASIKNLLGKIPLPPYYHLGKNGYAIPKDNGGTSTVGRQSFLIHLEKAGYPSNGLAPDYPENQMEMALTRIEKEQSVDWCGRLAGRHQGLRRVGTRDLLVQGGPIMAAASPTHCDELLCLLAQVLGMEPIANRSLSPFHLFCHWLKRSRRMIREGKWCEGQAIVFCGPVDSFKSFIQGAIITPPIGQEAFPTQFLKGGTGFNSDLVGAEHLRIDDAAPPMESRDRSEWANVMKQFVMERNRRLHGKGTDALMVDPLQRVSIACNDSGEGYRLIPRISRDNRDKFLVFRTRVPELARQFHSEDERRAYAENLASQLPGFLHLVDNLGPVPQTDVDLRFGIRGHIDASLELLVNDDQPEDILLSMLDQNLPPGAVPIEGTGQEVYRRLEQEGCASFLRLSGKETPGAAVAKWLVQLSQDPDHAGRISVIRSGPPKRFRIAPLEGEHTTRAGGEGG